MNSTTRLLLASLALWGVLSSAGCQMLQLSPLPTVPVADAEHPVVEVICVWQPGEGTGMDGLPCRGFAGQVLFFAMGEKAPVRVKGKVRVYVFDDQGTEEEQQQPIHQFDFDSGAFSGFLTHTNMGAAYQLFIPYTRKGSHSAACTLRVRYTPDEGSSVYSKMATVILPGTTPRKQELPLEQAVHAVEQHQAGSGVVQASGEAAGGKVEETLAAVRAANQASASNAANEDKKRLRSTLNEISKISPASPGTGMQNSGEEGNVDRPASLKLHPLNSIDAAGSPASSEEPVSQSAEPVVPAEPAPQESTGTASPAGDSSQERHPLADD